MSDDHTLYQIPLAVRISLAHAYFQRLAERNQIDLLHVKGYAFAQEVYREGRRSSDVDLLVRPAHVERFVYLLKADGWKLQADFATGSIFEHAATLYHPSWGLTDVHRLFPGLGEDPAGAFEQLWKQRRTRSIAHVDCWVPSLVDARMLVVLHAAKDKMSYLPDVDFLESTLSEQEWAEVEQRVEETNSAIAYATARGRIEDYRTHPDYLFWKSVSQDVPEYVQWWARLKKAEGLSGKTKTIKSIFEVNVDHLAMELGHDPSPEEIRAKFLSRFKLTKMRKK